jgi:hypothetical protein
MFSAFRKIEFMETEPQSENTVKTQNARIPQTDFRFARDAVGEIIAAYKNYVGLLDAELKDVYGLAYAHGWKSQRVEAGEAARNRIESAVALWQTEVDWHEGRALDSLNAQQPLSVPNASESATASSKTKGGA